MRMRQAQWQEIRVKPLLLRTYSRENHVNQILLPQLLRIKERLDIRLERQERLKVFSQFFQLKKAFLRRFLTLKNRLLEWIRLNSNLREKIRSRIFNMPWRTPSVLEELTYLYYSRNYEAKQIKIAWWMLFHKKHNSNLNYLQNSKPLYLPTYIPTYFSLSLSFHT